MEKLPVEYHVEVYEESFVNDPSLSWSATTPFSSFHVGDYFDHRTADHWYKTPTNDERFKIKEIEHIIWSIDNSHIGHKLMVCLEIVER